MEPTRRSIARFVGLAGAYAAAQGLSSIVAERLKGEGTREQYDAFRQPAFAPPGVVFPIVWTGLNLTTAASAWRVLRTQEAAPADQARVRREALAWWTAAVVVRSGYVPLAFGQRRLWPATVDSVLLCAVMTRYAVVAAKVDRAAAVLAVPEIAWTAFASVLSADVARLNG